MDITVPGLFQNDRDDQDDSAILQGEIRVALRQRP